MQSIDFGIEPETFEKGIEKLGKILGFTSHRPEKITGKGPDNLWGITGNQYWTISCKNDVDLERNFISKKENGQLVNEIAWFSQQYSESKGTHVLIHPAKILNHNAFLDSTAYVILPEKLKLLKNNVQKFYNSVANITEEISSTIIRNKLSESQLDLMSMHNIYLEQVIARKT